ncbi:C4b-binding protein alpha chain-like isoform X2 [Tachysurus vachellii]|uniref:C4b-binding protein alpha chain-like isoform X2 n=1 Tax=Tachysurus vachellii TaxID=175792 RepID=UPI00296B3EB5|nr:C4b-binding protein alpha chain-like isoform X2 [Tachysurus vachellii]
MLCYVIISILLTMAVKVRAQCDTPVVGGNRIMTEGLQQGPFPEGSTIKFKCSTGYVPERRASSSITCMGTQWSELELQCRKKSCGNPGEITNGKYLYQPTDAVLFGAVVTAVCNKGYQLVGYEIRNCRETGWDGRPPLCEAVKCQAPPDVTDGTFEPAEEFYAYGDGVTYSCKRGLNLIGSSTIICSDKGHFRPDPPQCLLVTCERPEILNAVRIEGKSPPYKYSEFVRYQCNKGYKMEGSDRMICTEKGWDPPPPQCTAVKCQTPPAVTDGTFEPVKEFYSYEDEVTYSCKRGLNLIGSSVLTCSDEGHFRPDPPQCLLMTCETPEILNAFRIEGKSPPYKYRDFVRYRCNEGYKMEGSDRMICTEKGWDPPPPQCTAVKCQTPPAVTDGTFEPVKEFYSYEDEVTYSCKRGLNLIGSSVLTCSDEGHFRPDPPQCLLMTCETPEILNAFRIEGKSPPYKYRDFVRYRCNEGYKMEGSDRMICTEKGWDPPPPQCTVVKCKPPPAVTDGTFNPDKEQYTYGDEVTYSCKRGLNLVGSSVLTCSDKGHFQPDPPQCLHTTCDAPHIINGFIIGDESTFYRYKSSVRVECYSFYKMEGSDILTCEENGWNPPSPKCYFNLVWISAVIIVALIFLVLCIVYCYMKFRKPNLHPFSGMKQLMPFYSLTIDKKSDYI